MAEPDYDELLNWLDVLSSTEAREAAAAIRALRDRATAAEAKLTAIREHTKGWSATRFKRFFAILYAPANPQRKDGDDD